MVFQHKHDCGNSVESTEIMGQQFSQPRNCTEKVQKDLINSNSNEEAASVYKTDTLRSRCTQNPDRLQGKIMTWCARQNREIVIDCTMQTFFLPFMVQPANAFICSPEHTGTESLCRNTNMLNLLDKTCTLWWYYFFELDEVFASPGDADNMCCKSSR